MPRHVGFAICACAVLVFAVNGCKRVPSEQVFVPQAMSAIEAGQKISHKKQDKLRLEALSALCTRACENWLEHQFIVPVSYDDQSESLQELLDEVIDTQRDNNRDACVTSCEAAENRPRAQCIASAPSILDIEDCRL